MIVTGSPPPYRPSPKCLRDRSLQDVRARDTMVVEFDKTTERKRPKSSPLKISKKKSEEINSKETRRNCKESIRTIEGAFSEKGTMYFKVVQPGYMIAKRRSGVNVTLNMDKLWAGATKGSGKKSLPIQDEREMKIKKLQKEIDDLQATLAEERISHRSEFHQFVENTKIDVEVMLQEHRDHIKTIEEDHELDLENLKAMYQAKINAEKEEANIRAAQMQEEIDLVTETLESCKEDVTSELEKQWLDRKEELHAEHELKIEQLLKEQRLKLKSKRIAACNDLIQQHTRDLDSVKEAHRKEVNALHDEFALFAADAENLKIVALEAEKLKEEMTELQDVHARTKEKLRKTKNELADAKVQLQGYELSFSEKVAEVEERYSMKIQGLMLNNTDIRRNYMKKCAQFLDVQNKNDSPKERKISNTKNTMKTIILARAKADVSLVTETQKIENASPKRTLSPVRRPRSAPTCKPETSDEDNLFLTVSELRIYRPNSSLV